jgi:hypothetical protein
MNILQHIARAAAELLTLPDPFPDRYEPPTVTGTRTDSKGRTVLQVRAQNYRDVSRLTEGKTAAGNVSQVHTHTGNNQWEIHVEDNR